MTREEIIDLLRTELLRLLREDASLRRELLDAIGGSALQLVAEELIRLRQDFSVRFEAIERAQLEHSRRFEVIEQTLAEQRRDFAARFEVIEQTLLEHSRRFEAFEQALAEQRRDFAARFEVIERTLLEHSQRFELMQQTLLEQGKLLAEMRVGMGSLGGRVGRNLEESIRVAIERFSGISPLKAERLVLRDEDGEIFQPGSDVEFDALEVVSKPVGGFVRRFEKSHEIAPFDQAKTPKRGF